MDVIWPPASSGRFEVLVWVGADYAINVSVWTGLWCGIHEVPWCDKYV